MAKKVIIEITLKEHETLMKSINSIKECSDDIFRLISERDNDYVNLSADIIRDNIKKMEGILK